MKWEFEQRSIDDLKPQKKNPRKATKEQKKQISQSLSKFGVCEPIVIANDGTIIGGHQRYDILKAKGSKIVDCMVCQDKLTQEQIDELTIRLNKNGGMFDFDLLAEGYEPEALVDWGFSMDELDLESIPDQKEKPKTFQLTINFENEDALRDFEGKFATMNEFSGATYKVKIK